MSNLAFYSNSGIQIRRPIATSNGVNASLDPLVKAQLDELAALLSKRILPAARHDPEAMKQFHTSITELLHKPLTPKFIPNVNKHSWDAHSLAFALDTGKVGDGMTLTEYIDTNAAISSLKYDFNNSLTENWNNFDYNTTACFNGYPEIVDYLIAYGAVIMGMTEVHGLSNFIFKNTRGLNAIRVYATVGATRALVQNEQLRVPDINDNGFVGDPKSVLAKILASNVLLSATSFQSGVSSVINDLVFNDHLYALIDSLRLDLPPNVRARLVSFIKSSPIPITDHNAKVLIPGLIVQNMAALTASGPIAGGDGAQGDGDYGVEYLADDSSSTQVNQSSVLCAAQLFYSMVLGDELNVFDAMNYFAHRYLVRQSIQISDPQLRADLQLYVFSNKFTDLKTNRIEERSRPAERAMFYRQVFNWGRGHTTEDVIINREFGKLWKVLMLESAAYIERAQISPNPDSFVSRQKVMQAVEDLQYNLSTHSTGMANVITPMLYAELNFIIQRIFMHSEIIRQVVPQGGTWWRVVETLYIAIKNARPRSTVLYNKAKLGDQILRLIAGYSASSFEQDQSFGEFISLVDAFITTQSILQRGLSEDLARSEDDEAGDEAPPAQSAATAPPPPPASPPTGGAPEKQNQDEWAF